MTMRAQLGRRGLGERAAELADGGAGGGDDDDVVVMRISSRLNDGMGRRASLGLVP